MNDVKRYQFVADLHEKYCKRCGQLEMCVRKWGSFSKMLRTRANSQKGVGRHMHGQEAEEATYMSCFQAFNGELPE